MKKLLRPLFRGVSNAYGAVARLTYPWLPLPPLRITLTVTSRCNLSCPYCYVREDLNQDESNRLSLDEWKRVIDTIPRRMLVMLGGGEPFVTPDIMGILEHLFATRHLVAIVTNGTALDASRVERLVDGPLRYLMVSIDGMAEYHDNLRGMAGAFGRIESVFRTLHELKRRKGRSYPLTCIKTTVTEDNYEEIPKLMEFAETELRADHMAFSLLVQNPLQEGFKLMEDLGDPRFSQGNTYAYPEAVRPHIRELIERIFAYKKKTQMQIEFAPRLGSKERLLDYVDDPLRFGVKRCNIPWIEFNVYFDGRIAPCVTYLIDNVRNLGYDVRKVIRHPRYREFLSFFRSAPYRRPCEGCCWGRHTPR